MKITSVAVQEMVMLLDETETGLIEAALGTLDAFAGLPPESDTAILESALRENQTAVIQEQIGDDTQACDPLEIASALSSPLSYALPLAHLSDNPLPRIYTVSVRGFVGEWESLE